MHGSVQEVLDKIKEKDLVLDVGGWACPFNRANWVLDAEPHETRGFYGKVGLPAFQGPEKEHFTRDTWVVRDICDHKPWPFTDKFFDFSICSHTLEDVRDPLSICTELVRVSKAGYIEIPSRLSESIRGVENHKIVGFSHHRWLIEKAGNHLQFTQKYHMIHGDFDLSLPNSYQSKLSVEDSIVRLFWTDQFTFAETILHGLPAMRANLKDFVAKHHSYPGGYYLVQKLDYKARKAFKGLRRRVGI